MRTKWMIPIYMDTLLQLLFKRSKRDKKFLKVAVIRYHKLHLDSSRATINFSVEEMCPFETG